MTVPYSVCCKAHRKRLVHSSQWRETVDYILYFSLRFFLPACFAAEQSTGKASLFVKRSARKAYLFSRGASMVKFLVITTWPCNHSITYAVSRRQKVPVE